MPSAEIFAVLTDEMTETRDALGTSLADLGTATDEAAFAVAVAEYVEHVQRMALASQALNLEGLSGVCTFVQRNVEALNVGELDADRHALFQLWPELVLYYLSAPRDDTFSRELAELFRESDWPQPLSVEAVQALQQALITYSDDELDTQPQRESVAQPEDVALEIPSDVNPKLVEAFLAEGPLQANEYSILIQRLLGGNGGVNELNECRRLIHATKGAAHTVGVRGIASLCHHVEDIFEWLVDNAARPDGKLGRLLIKVADTLEMMFETLQGIGDAPNEALAVLQEVLDAINGIERGEYDAAPLPSSEPVAVAQPDADDVPLVTAPVDDKKADLKIRIPVDIVDKTLEASGEITITTSHVRERIQQALKVLAELRERHSSLWDQTNGMESFVNTQGVTAARRQTLAAANGTAAPGFDPLEIDQYSEMHTYVQELAETVADLQLLSNSLVEALTTADTAVHQQALLNNEMHELLMTARMVPAGSLRSRLERTVRQVANQCTKKASLTIQGADVMLDNQMMTALVDPLQHLLRNAVDHGLEFPDQRVDQGKPEAGNIVLSFRRDGNYLVVVCRDDGAGLDIDRIRQRATAQGLYSVGHAASDNEIARLILQPGFSTAPLVTEVSGRGMGMDIVHTAIAKLKGTVDIRTQPNNGVTFTLRMPMSLGIAHCLLTSVGSEKFAFPSDNLAHLVYEGAKHVQRVADGWRFDDGELNCPAYPLTQLVGGTETPSGDRARHVVIMNDMASKVAIVVDAITGGRDLVIKNVGRFLKSVNGVMGASILGDGSVVPILDLPVLIHSVRGESVSARGLPTRDDNLRQTDVLVVDDSLSVRTALTLFLAEEGFQVRAVRDGIEAIEAIGARRPAVVLADMEMPRMNGIELTAHIRAHATMHDLPVIMLTSRTAEKHRKLATDAGVDAYLTKPYRENDLLVQLRTILNHAVTTAA